MTLEQKIKDAIEDLLSLGGDFLLGYSVSPLGLEFSQEQCEDKFYKIEKALEVIREQQKQLDRMRDTEKLASIICEGFGKNYEKAKNWTLKRGSISFPEYEISNKTARLLQNYILGGEGAS